MGLSQRRVDETAWTHEQPHRGTAATPLATAILNLRHGQGAVARRLVRQQSWQEIVNESLILIRNGCISFRSCKRITIPKEPFVRNST